MSERAIDDLRNHADEYTWYEPADPTPRHACPCCDYITLPERGQWLICPVCYWEDDSRPDDAVDSPSGCNQELTVRQARNNFAEFGASALTFVNSVLTPSEREQFRRVEKVLQ